MLFLLGLAKDAVVWLSQSIREEKRGTGAIWDTYNFTARPNSVYIYIYIYKFKKYVTSTQILVCSFSAQQWNYYKNVIILNINLYYVLH